MFANVTDIATESPISAQTAGTLVLAAAMVPVVSHFGPAALVVPALGLASMIFVRITARRRVSRRRRSLPNPLAL
jgi:hypothetical protein